MRGMDTLCSSAKSAGLLYGSGRWLYYIPVLAVCGFPYVPMWRLGQLEVVVQLT